LVLKDLRQFPEKRENYQILILGGHMVNVNCLPHRHFTSVFTV